MACERTDYLIYLSEVETQYSHPQYQVSVQSEDAALQVIGWFWEVVHGLTEAQKKRLLMFVTGSDRVPIKGLASLQPPFVISRNGPASDRLPTAHTCFNHLLLPAYKASPNTRA